MTATRERHTDAPPRAVEPDRTNPAVRRTLITGAASLLGVLTLKGLLRDYGWIVDVWLTVVVVVAPAAVIRLWRRPGAFDVWPGVVLMIPWLTLRFLPDHALLGVIPTGGTLDDISRFMTDLHNTSSSQAAPIQSTPAVRLVVCVLIGLLAALIDLVAVVGRRPALAGIPLLVVYTVSGAVSRHAVAWVWFAAAAAAFLLLLSLDAADDRRSWGHRVGGTRERDVVSQTGPIIGVLAVLVAIVVPFVVPLPSDNIIANAFRGDGNGSSGFGAGGGSGGTINPFASLKGSLKQGKDRDLMTVHIDGPASLVPFYLRTNVLDSYVVDEGWQVSDHGATETLAGSGLEAEPNNDRPAATRFTATIKVSGLGGNVPIFTALDEVDSVPSGTKWSAQDQLLLGPSVRRGSTIVERVQQATPTKQDLLDAPSAGSDTQRWRTTPTLPKQVTSLVTRLTGRYDTQYEKARAISDYFASPANGFTYSLDTVEGDSGSELVDFLTNKQGYCQQYAAAMAIMLRAANIPSRVVLGYMHAPPNSKGDFTVTSHDAHAWVEAYFGGLGWVPFDPTPTTGLSGGASSDLPYAPHDYPSDSGQDSNAPKSSAAAPTTSGASASAAPTSAASAPVQATTEPGRGSSTWPAVLAGILVALAAGVGLTPAAVREARRRRRRGAARSGDADAVWAELTDTAVDLGFVWSPARSPRQVAEWLGAEWRGADADAARSSLSTLALAEEQRRYRGAGDGSTGANDGSVTVGHGSTVVGGGRPNLDAPLQDVTGALRAQRSARTRIRSILWPASLGWGRSLRRGRH